MKIVKLGSIFFFLFVLQFSVQAQKLEFSIQTGIGSYFMNDLKVLQEDILNDLNIPNAKRVSSFPIYGNYGMSIGLIRDGYSLSFFSGYESTGSRIAYSDYSGSFFYDQLADQFLFGGAFKLYTNDRIDISRYFFTPFITLRSGVSFSRITFKDELTIGNQSASGNLDLREISSFFEPGVGLSLSFSSINLEPYFSFHIPTYRTGLFLKGEPDSKLEDEDGVLHAGWFGFRSGISLILKL